ncbi:hypothetical protein AMS68_005938 [Peltaster fructicola]|uniref:Uncharacterized protein n=1 Tax=Peltaster fructicola TaxID=286661 RepID=A0A6H0Y0H3_9PEZI|nr:hypothetical protein AMS68_005938 [Peltaster fructicola]
MDFWTRLFGVTYTPRKPPAKPVVTSQDRLTRFQTALADVERLCSNKRDLAREKSTLAELQKLIEKLAQIIREETRASIPHPCVAWALKKAIFVTVNRAAAVSFHEGCIHAAITLMAALVDSEEDSFLTNTSFAKSLMRLVTRIINAGDVLLSIETETFILELLFTISAKIRLQPEILPSWFTVTARAEPREKGTTTKDDFPLCYILVDRIYHDGRIGDFARTGLLYIFEATGKSTALETWIVESSDVCTLMASGLGALYSQLSRELSILYPDAVLPATLALSDYTTTQPQARAESAFSERHIAHMTTFLSYLAFWQDILDHCKSDEVRQSLLDHFQVLFLQQLLYPSILESSDTDKGSSVAVLSYLTAILESLEHPVLTDSIMSFLLAVEEPSLPQSQEDIDSSVELKRRQSLLELSVASGLDEAVEPVLFNLSRGRVTMHSPR